MPRCAAWLTRTLSMELITHLTFTCCDGSGSFGRGTIAGGL